LKNSGIPIVNKAKLAAYIQTAGNSEMGQKASQYLAAVNTLKEEFANLANGGYAPTEAAWALANSQINGNYGVQQLNASLTEVQRLINFRLQAFDSLTPYGVTSGNPVLGTGVTPPPIDTASPALKIGSLVRNKKTGEVAEVTGIRPDGSLILKPVPQ